MIGSGTQLNKEISILHTGSDGTERKLTGVFSTGMKCFDKNKEYYVGEFRANNRSLIQKGLYPAAYQISGDEGFVTHRQCNFTGKDGMPNVFKLPPPDPTKCQETLNCFNRLKDLEPTKILTRSNKLGRKTAFFSKSKFYVKPFKSDTFQECMSITEEEVQGYADTIEHDREKEWLILNVEASPQGEIGEKIFTLYKLIRPYDESKSKVTVSKMKGFCGTLSDFFVNAKKEAATKEPATKEPATKEAATTEAATKEPATKEPAIYFHIADDGFTALTEEQKASHDWMKRLDAVAQVGGLSSNVVILGKSYKIYVQLRMDDGTKNFVTVRQAEKILAKKQKQKRYKN